MPIRPLILRAIGFSAPYLEPSCPRCHDMTFVQGWLAKCAGAPGARVGVLVCLRCPGGPRCGWAAPAVPEVRRARMMLREPLKTRERPLPMQVLEVLPWAPRKKQTTTTSYQGADVFHRDAERRGPTCTGGGANGVFPSPRECKGSSLSLSPVVGPNPGAAIVQYLVLRWASPSPFRRVSRVTYILFERGDTLCTSCVISMCRCRRCGKDDWRV